MSEARKGKNIGRIVEYLKIECKYCNNAFEVNPAGIKRGRNKFCSRKCYSLWQSENKRGENHINWKGGISTLNQFIRNSFEYKLWRRAVFERDNFSCVECGRKKSVSGKLTADHIKPFSLFPELRFELSNGRTLCRECHEKTDTWVGRIIKLKKAYAKNT